MKKKVLSLFLTVTLVSTSFLETAWAAEPQAPSAVEAASASDSAADINLSTENTGENASADLDDSSLDGVSDDSVAAQSMTTQSHPIPEAFLIMPMLPCLVQKTHPKRRISEPTQIQALKHLILIPILILIPVQIQNQ